MDTVQLMIDVLGPVVLIVAAGALVGPRVGLQVETLSKIAYWIFGPAFVFNIFATTTLEVGAVIRLAAAGAAGLAASVVAALVLARGLGVRGNAASVSYMSAAYGNVGNAGLAICAFALGAEALDQAGVLMVTIMFLGTLLAVWLGTRQTRTSLCALWEAVSSPMIVAAIVGLVINLVGFDPPVVVDRTIATVASGLIPTMLVGLGIQLATAGRVRWARSTTVVSVAKLLIAPLVAVFAGRGLGLEGAALGVVLLQSAMPPAVFCMVIALEHDLEPDQATNDVVAVTIAALLTLPVALVIAV